MNDEYYFRYDFYAIEDYFLLALKFEIAISLNPEGRNNVKTFQKTSFNHICSDFSNN